MRSSGSLLEDEIFFLKEVIGLDIRPTGELSDSSLNYHYKPLKIDCRKGPQNSKPDNVSHGDVAVMFTPSLMPMG